MDSIIQSIESNSDQVKTHLNDNVLQTEASLYEEILLTEMYLYTGNQNPEYSHLSREDKALLTSYLESLYNYRSAVEEMKGVTWLKDLDPDEPLLARVNQYEYNKPEDPQAFYIETNIVIATYQADKYTGREDFFNVEDDNYGNRQFSSQISYYESGDDLQREHNLEARDAYANHTSDYIGEKILSISLNVLMKGLPFTDYVNDFIDYTDGKSDKELQMTEGDAILAANNFGLEIQVLERVSSEGGRNPYEIKFLTTDETHTIMDRWKEVVDSGSSIPYPYQEGEIPEDNWYLISDYFQRHQSEMKGSFSEEYDYIFDK